MTSPQHLKHGQAIIDGKLRASTGRSCSTVKGKAKVAG